MTTKRLLKTPSYLTKYKFFAVYKKRINKKPQVKFIANISLL